MAQASSAQREPSMEEILASIRRIIEDSDTTPATKAESGATDGARAIASPAVQVTDQPADEEGGAEIVEVDSFSAEFEPEMDEFEQPTQEDEPAPARLADIQAEVEARAAEMDASEAVRASASPMPIQDRQPAEHDAGADGADASDRDSADTRHASLERSDNDAAWWPDLVGSAGPEQADDVAADAHREGAPAILSEVTGRRVAAAFDELSDAFDASRRRSFDEMAEEMLRPMLQDWLDNNLPTLVEKLVREEIERVARGGTR